MTREKHDDDDDDDDDNSNNSRKFNNSSGGMKWQCIDIMAIKRVQVIEHLVYEGNKDKFIRNFIKLELSIGQV